MDWFIQWEVRQRFFVGMVTSLELTLQVQEHAMIMGGGNHLWECVVTMIPGIQKCIAIAWYKSLLNVWLTIIIEDINQMKIEPTMKFIKYFVV